MSDLVYIKGSNGLVIGFPKDVADGLLRHSDISKASAPEPKAPDSGSETPPAGDAPAGNAPTADWHAYALTQGKTEAELEGLGQREIRALFTE